MGFLPLTDIKGERKMATSDTLNFTENPLID
jgi:hypothetical protein